MSIDNLEEWVKQYAKQPNHETMFCVWSELDEYEKISLILMLGDFRHQCYMHGFRHGHHGIEVTAETIYRENSDGESERSVVGF